MSTNAAIIRKTEEGNYESISCHWDGYLEHVGELLLKHYSDPAKVKALISLGNISSLDERLDPTGPHTWAKPEDGVTIAYHRDRGEKLISQTFGRLESASSHYRADFTYLFDGEAWLWLSENGPVLISEAFKSTNQDA